MDIVVTDNTGSNPPTTPCMHLWSTHRWRTGGQDCVNLASITPSECPPGASSHMQMHTQGARQEHSLRKHASITLIWLDTCR